MDYLNTYSITLKSTQSITSIKNILGKESIYITGYKYKKEIYNDKYIFTPISESFLYVNSFVPVVEIVLSESLNGTLIGIKFKLVRSVEVIFTAFILMGAVFQISLIVYCINIKNDNILVMFIPLLWIILLLIIKNIGFGLSSRKILRKLRKIMSI